MGAELREKKGRPGVPLRPFLAYTLSNSQWYIQWLRTLRNRGAERLPKNYRKPVDVSTLTGFFHGENRDVTMREGMPLGVAGQAEPDGPLPFAEAMALRFKFLHRRFGNPGS